MEIITITPPHSTKSQNKRKKTINKVFISLILTYRAGGGGGGGEGYYTRTNQIKSNQINFIGIKSSHRTVTSHMYTVTVTQEQSHT